MPLQHERVQQQPEADTIIEVPSKKRKIEASDITSRDASYTAVKLERIPSPPQSSSNRASLRTSGVFFVKHPRDCLSGQSNWKANRDRCLLEATTKLQSLGLRILRRLVRDDGLAFDWASEVPIDPVTLKPPNPTQDNNQVSTNSISTSGSDLLGHALRDQDVILRQSSTYTEPAIQPGAPDVTRLMNVDRCTTLVEPPSEENAEFVTVGAAIKSTPCHDDHPGPSSSPLKEYRRLIPLDLRIYQQFGHKFKYRLQEPADRRRRRMEWIQKEIEKIEGYTGEKVVGYRYDRNDVIINLKSKNASASNQSNRPIPNAPKYMKKQLLGPLKKGKMVKPQPSGAVSALAPAPSNPSSKRLPNNVQTPSQLANPPDSSNPQTRIKSPPRPLSQPHSSNERNSPTRLSSNSFSAQTEMSVSHPQSSSNAHSVSPKCFGNQSSSLPKLQAAEASDMSVSLLSQPSFSPQAAPSPPPNLSRNPSPQQTFSDSGTTESRGLQFLERYLMLFDTNRKALMSAFNSNATFSLTNDAQGIKSSQVTNGLSAIGQVVEKLDNGLHHSIKGNISYDMTPMDDVDPGAMMLTCDGTIVPRDYSTPTRTFSRIFVLRRNANHDRNEWPLKISTEKLRIKRI